MTSENEDFKSIKVLPWTGKDEDWPMWSKKFLLRGRKKGYKKIMDGTMKVPDDLDIDVDSKKTSFPEDDQTQYRMPEHP